MIERLLLPVNMRKYRKKKGIKKLEKADVG
jgi:hypothetical protein